MIEDFVRRKKVKRVPASKPEEPPPESLFDDLVQIGETFGAYRRKKHNGSDEP